MADDVLINSFSKHTRRKTVILAGIAAGLFVLGTVACLFPRTHVSPGPMPGGLPPNPVPSGPEPVAPSQKDPLGLAGTWKEFWPGDAEDNHDISVITFQNGQYQVAVKSPKEGQYKVDAVRIEGSALKFTEHTHSWPYTIPYEITVKDANTSAVSVPGWSAEKKGPIVWKREPATP